MANCLGSVISVDCGSTGYYQGKLVAIDPDTKNITLSSAFKEGIPVGKNITLNGSQIVSLKVLKTAEVQHTGSNLSVPVKTEKKVVTKKDPDISLKKSGHSVMQRSKSANGMPIEENFAQSEVQMKSNRWQTRYAATSSSDSEDGSPETSSNFSKEKIGNRQNGCRQSESEHIHSHGFGITATPLFKRFDPQIPQPKQLVLNTRASKLSRKDRGPCGIPNLDTKRTYGKISDRNTELNKPLDFDLLDTDFDFDANLEIFKREDIDDEFYENVEKPKMSQNFAHYENIISDPTRCTSWTSIVGSSACRENAENRFSYERNSPPVRAISFCPSGMESTRDGFSLPVLDAALKKKYLRECSTLFGLENYYTLVADRLIMWIMDIIERHDMAVENLVVLASAITPVRLVDRLITHIDNRGCKATIYGKFPGLDLSGITVAEETSTLPIDPEMIVMLADDITNETMAWLSKQKNAHVVSLETAPSIVDADKLHVLMIGVLTSGVYSVPSAGNSQPLLGKTSFAQLCAAIKASKNIDVAVCDIGAPFSWIAEDGRTSLAQAFSNKLLCRL